MRHSFVRDLMEAAQRGDRAGFDRIFDAGFGVVYALAFQRAAGDRACAEQMTSRVFVQGVRGALELAPIVEGAHGEAATSESRDSAA